MKEVIRRIMFALCEGGLCDPEIVCTSGTLKHRFYNWLYGNPEPLFVTQWPDDGKP